MSDFSNKDEATGLEIAVIGMAGQFPGARDVGEFWENLKNGVESISSFSDEELLAAGVRPELLSDPNYVRAGAILEGFDLFDAAFFGFNPREAETLDPQQRLFLECAWAAMEDAGYAARTSGGSRVGVYAGASMNTYVFNLRANREFMDAVGLFPVLLGNDKDFLATRVSYQLNLAGPSMVVQTACSTSLVAVHVACQSLLNGECDMALAGGVSVRVPIKAGYVYQEGGILSPDGRCRAFDARAQGTVAGNGVGIVVLKRLDEALEDGDTIRAVIKGSAINNDGSLKIGFTAPRIDGQAEVIRAAQSVAGVDAATVSYIEAHGTGTALGDPIEIAALTQAFGGAAAERKQFCAIGSVKTNLGHTDAAAGVISLIKTVLALEHKALPPSLHFESASPQLGLENSPFYVNNRLSPWRAEGEDAPRRAGVSSFGIGGTNAHVVLEESPVSTHVSAPARDRQLIVLSGKTAGALDAATTNLASHLRANPDLNLADAAYTYQVGRKAFKHRRALVSVGAVEAAEILETRDHTRLLTGEADESFTRHVVYMFPGQGAQHAGMFSELYQTERTFRSKVDECVEFLRPRLGLDLREVLFPEDERRDEAERLLEQTRLTQPALFTVEYALAVLWSEWGVRPEAMIGHSLGEYVAACLAGVFSLEDSLAIVAERGRLIQELPSGAMLAVGLPEAEVQTWIGEGLSLASVNSPTLCVVAGEAQAVETLEKRLMEREVFCRRLRTSHAFHSAMMEPVMPALAALVAEKKPRAPRIPYISNVTGTWIRDDEATSPRYWAEHLRRTVRFADGVRELLKHTSRILLEVGPGHTLSVLARQQPEMTAASERVIASLAQPPSHSSESEQLLTATARLWLGGVEIDWQSFHQQTRRRRIPLPTYPFERRRFWIDADEQGDDAVNGDPKRERLAKLPDKSDWFSFVSWKRSQPKSAVGLKVSGNGSRSARRWLVFIDDCGLGAELAGRLRSEGDQVVVVSAGARFAQHNEHHYQLNPQQGEDYTELLKELRWLKLFPQKIAHLWSVTAEEETADEQPVAERLENALDAGFRSLLHLTRALNAQRSEGELDLAVVSNGMQKVLGNERLRPEKATLLGACKVIPLEYTQISCRSIDVTLSEGVSALADMLRAEVEIETEADSPEVVVALRGQYRWVQTFELLSLPEVSGEASPPLPLRREGVYLIVGGLGGIGLELARHLAQSVRARLVLTGRTKLPPRHEWESRLARHDDPDGVGDKLKKLLELEAEGAEVLTLNADVTSESEMRETLTRAREAFGEIHGVIHAAGVAGNGLIELLTEEAISEVLAPKVRGTLVLDSLLRDKTPDFLVLCSSVTALVGEAGQADYCAANAFLDAFAQARGGTQGATNIVSINWGAWQRVGMTTRAFVPDEFKELYEKNLSAELLPEEGVEAFDRALSASQPQVIVSTRRLDDLRQWAQLRSPAGAGGESVMPSTAARFRLHPRPPLATPYTAPSNETERAIARIWQQLLGVEEVGINDNFFDLGGHSLLGTQIVSHVCGAFNVKLSLRHLFETPTMAAFALAVEEAMGGAAQEERADPGIKPVARDGELPLSFAQQRLWFLDQLEPGSPLYNLPVVISLKGRLDVAALTRSFEEIVRRHESLRTNFVAVDGQPTQVIADSQELDLTVTDLSDLDAGEREAEAQRRIREAIVRPFNLAEGPLLRLLLLRLSEQEHLLALVMHHIVSDAWSLAVLGREFTTLYEAITSGHPAPLPELKIQYADFAHWQRRWMQGEVLERQLSYWRERLAGAPPLLRLPTDRPRPATQSFAGAAHHFTLPDELTQAVRDLSNRERVTPFMTLLTAFKIFLYKYSGQPDIVVGADIANRNREETENLIGFFINMLVLRTDLSGNPTFLELVGRVSEVTLSAYAHQDLPLERLVEELQPQRATSYPPLFQIVFNYYPAPEDSLNLQELSVSFTQGEHDIAKFDLSLFISESAIGLSGHWRYSTALFDASTVARMDTLFETLLRSIVARPEARLSDLEMFPAAEQEQRVAARKELKKSNFNKFRSITRKTIDTSTETLVELSPLESNETLPLVVRPRSNDVDLQLWAQSNADFLHAKLAAHGALLFRDFNVDSTAKFDDVSRALVGELLDYSEPSSPRTQIKNNIYTSTEYPASQWIRLHNEMSYSHNWPHKVVFCCLTPAERGGQTPIAYSRRVFDLLAPQLRERFMRKRVMYVRNYSKNLDLPWQQVFGTSSREAVEEQCRQTGIEFEWTGEGGLRTRQVRQAVLQHPGTGEMLWFNQAHAFHVAALEPAVREALRGEMKEEDFPRNACYGDGSPIEDGVIEEIFEAYRQASVMFDWRRGDVLLLENMLVAHGRAPFSGSRKILVAMSGLLNEREVVRRFEENRKGHESLSQPTAD